MLIVQLISLHGFLFLFLLLSGACEAGECFVVIDCST